MRYFLLVWENKVLVTRRIHIIYKIQHPNTKGATFFKVMSTIDTLLLNFTENILYFC